MTTLKAVALGALALLAVAAVAAAQPFPNLGPEPAADHPVHFMHNLRDAFVALPFATLLGAALALRPRRRGTPARNPAVIQTQIILAIVGALIMLIVGASVARAFAIVGAAGLVRYRSKIDDPKDAGVMLSALAVGLSAGVGLYALGIFGTLFVMAVLWVIESFEPEKLKMFELKVKSKDAAALREGIESLLRRQQIKYELRTSAADELSYEVQVPLERRTDKVSNAILRLEGAGEATSVEWDEKKKKT